MRKKYSTLPSLDNISISDIIECLISMQQEERLKCLKAFLLDKKPPACIVNAVEHAVAFNRSLQSDSLRKKLEDLGVSASKDLATFEA